MIPFNAALPFTHRFNVRLAEITDEAISGDLVGILKSHISSDRPPFPRVRPARSQREAEHTALHDLEP